MDRKLRCTVLLSAGLMVAGCGGAEAPPLSEAGVDPPQEQQDSWKEQSLKMGSAPKGVKSATPPAEESK